jgi:hypothetical protein
LSQKQAKARISNEHFDNFAKNIWLFAQRFLFNLLQQLSITLIFWLKLRKKIRTTIFCAL